MCVLLHPQKLKKMRRTFIITILLLWSLTATAQQLTLQQCHYLATQSNPTLKAAQERIDAADALLGMAFCQFLPKVDALGTYVWNEKSIHLLSDQQANDINHIGTTVENDIENSLDDFLASLGVTSPTLAQHVVESLGGMRLEENLNNMGRKVTDAMNIDMHNILAGSVTVAQPLYLGGRLSALYRSAQYSCDMQQALGNKVYDGLLIAVDAAYWQYISLLHKQQLAQQYYDLLQNLDSNVVAMVDADVATRGDVTKVRVKLNEARMDLTKADCGLELARLALCQICGLDPNGDYVFVEDSTIVTYSPLGHIDMEKICAARDDYRALCDAKGIADQGVRLARAGLLPNVVATGSYVVSNPNLYNGYQNNFGGMFTAGVAVNIPLGHPGDIYALKAAKHKRAEAAYQVEESKNLIRLEVNRLNHQLKVANLKLQQAESDLDNAEENLRLADESFKAGVVSSTDLMAAQTAWMKAKTEVLDAEIELRLDHLYLMQATGESTLTVNG